MLIQKKRYTALAVDQALFWNSEQDGQASAEICKLWRSQTSRYEGGKTRMYGGEQRAFRTEKIVHKRPSTVGMACSED